MQPAQARVIDRGQPFPTWEPAGRHIPAPLRWRLELGGYGGVVMMIVLAVLGCVVVATRTVPPPPHAWQGMVAAIAFLAFGLLAIWADMRDGQRTLRLLRLGVVVTTDASTMRDRRGPSVMVHDAGHPHDTLVLADAPGDVVLDEHCVRMRRPISPAFLLAPLACAAMAAALVVLLAAL
ncbi:MAG: hypothetical protein ABI175_23535 [Polyangiales bacterium]